MKKFAIALLMLSLVAVLFAGASPAFAEQEEKTVLFDSCDQSYQWDVTVIDTRDCLEGSGALLAWGGIPSFTARFREFDSSVPFGEAYLEMFVYFEHTDGMNDGQIEFTSSGFSDADEYMWSFRNLNVQPGWNHLVLRFSDAAVTGSPSYEDLCMMRIYAVFEESNVMKIDDIRITNSPRSFTADQLVPDVQLPEVNMQLDPGIYRQNFAALYWSLGGVGAAAFLAGGAYFAFILLRKRGRKSHEGQK